MDGAAVRSSVSPGRRQLTIAIRSPGSILFTNPRRIFRPPSCWIGTVTSSNQHRARPAPGSAERRDDGERPIGRECPIQPPLVIEIQDGLPCGRRDGSTKSCPRSAAGACGFPNEVSAIRTNGTGGVSLPVVYAFGPRPPDRQGGPSASAQPVISSSPRPSRGPAQQSTSQPAAPLTVHEWGTFTSVAGQDGSALQWLPQGGPTDLPCFVERGFYFKGFMRGTVRMETPVLYFYTPRDVSVSVKVGFRQGLITEWFRRPWSARTFRARPTMARSSGRRQGLAGSDCGVPRRKRPQPLLQGPNTTRRHFQSGGQTEKFLFYRVWPVPSRRSPRRSSRRKDRGGECAGHAAAETSSCSKTGAARSRSKSGTRSRARHARSAGLEDASAGPQKDLVRIWWPTVSTRRKPRRWSTRGATRGSKKGPGSSTSRRGQRSTTSLL